MKLQNHLFDSNVHTFKLVYRNFSYIHFHRFAINFQCAIRGLELHVIILFIHKLWSFECAFFGINLVMMMAFNFNVWNIDKLNMEIISYLESKYDFFCAWEWFMGNHFKRAIGTIDWIWKKYFERGTHEHHLFMKKNKLTCDAISINVLNFFLHHVACAKNVKDVLDNLCATFENWHVGNTCQLH